MILLDGPMGTELAARGVPVPAPGWSANALVSAPHVVAAIHRDYAGAGATVHTANTFRAKRRVYPRDWERLVEVAVRIARDSVPSRHLVAGSIAPLEDCYRPDLSPALPRAEHREMARALARAGVDRILCETFPHAGEAVIAVDEAVRTGIETWVSLTAGPDAALMTPEKLARAARLCIERGAAAVLVSCVAAPLTLPYVESLATVGVPFGAYANGSAWAEAGATPDAYVEHAYAWELAGATIIGGCCGTTPAHIRALSTSL